jgi:single-stranded DNA-binding protein
MHGQGSRLLARSISWHTSESNRETPAWPQGSGSTRSRARTARSSRAPPVAISNVKKGSGEGREEEATSIQWTFWGKLAETAAEYLGKGSRVNIVGRVQNNNYEKAPARSSTASPSRARRSTSSTPAPRSRRAGLGTKPDSSRRRLRRQRARGTPDPLSGEGQPQRHAAQGGRSGRHPVLKTWGRALERPAHQSPVQGEPPCTPPQPSRRALRATPT